MGFFKLFGLSTEKEVEKRERDARSEGRSDGFSSGHSAGKKDMIREQQSSLSNIAKGSQVKFSVPYFDVFDPRFENFAVPVAVHGMVVYGVDDINKFNEINKAQNINDDVFQQKMKGQVTKFIKGVVANAPFDNNIQVLQMERKILELSELVQRLVSQKIEQLFGINVRSIDITQIIVDKDSRGYRELKAVTSELERDSMKRRHEMMFGGQEEMQRMQLENQRETMRIQREELQRASRLQTETNFLSAHQANLNAQVGMAQAQGGMQMPQMPGMPPIPGAVPQVQYMVGVNGQQIGPCDWQQLQQMVQSGQLTHQTYVWKQGMAQWQFAGEIQELLPLFSGMNL